MSMDKELYKQKIHQLVEKIKEDPELFTYLLSVVNKLDSSSAFIKLQRKKLRQKGRFFYGNLKDDKLRNQLINDYAMMLWYKSIGDIPRMFTFILFQIENMLNAYISFEGSGVYKVIEKNPNMYVYRYTNQHLKNDFIITAKDSFFDKKGSPQDLEKISIWAKYAYWFISTQQSENFKSCTHSLMSDIINLRNITEHRNSQKEIKKFTVDQIAYWEINIDSRFGYVDILLNTIQATIMTATNNQH